MGGKKVLFARLWWIIPLIITIFRYNGLLWTGVLWNFIPSPKRISLTLKEKQFEESHISSQIWGNYGFHYHNPLSLYGDMFPKLNPNWAPKFVIHTHFFFFKLKCHQRNISWSSPWSLPRVTIVNLPSCEHEYIRWAASGIPANKA